MAIGLGRMLEKCVAGQWRLEDFDWSATPVPLSEDRERRICAYYVDMSYIERLAGALFLSLADRASDPTLAAIFRTFHADELRHSRAAARLADYFDVHHYDIYTPDPSMLRFIPYFVSAIDSLHPAFATSLILGGELILDMALLRGLNAYVDDPLSRSVVERINQDESRHLAIDMHMTELFARDDRAPEPGATNPWLRDDFWGVLAWAPGFFTEVFFRPMQALDPSQEQMREAVRRFRRFYDSPSVAANPAVRQWHSVVDFFESSVGAALGGAIVAITHAVADVDLSFVRAASEAPIRLQAVAA